MSRCTRPTTEKQSSTSIKRNRCRLDQIGPARGYDVETTLKFDKDTAYEIVKEHWLLPEVMPTGVLHQYPPELPVLGEALTEAAAADLKRAFTLNSATYGIPGEKGNLLLEMVGDKYMGAMAASMVHRDIDRHGDLSVYSPLDLGGLDNLFKSICCGAQQSFFAMLYNFPARITAAFKTAPPDGLQTFSQRDMEGTFEAFLAVAVTHGKAEKVRIWFEELLQPWIPGFLEVALEYQMRRDNDWENPAQHRTKAAEKKHHAKILERRPARKADSLALPCIIYPTIRVPESSYAVSTRELHDGQTDQQGMGPYLTRTAECMEDRTDSGNARKRPKQ